MECPAKRSKLDESLSKYRVSTSPFSDQKPGTSGLRKKVTVFTDQENYLENFVQSVLDTIGHVTLAGATLVVGGDGRYLNQHAIQVIIQMARANGVGKILVGAGGLLSTPAMSSVIRARKALGGLILTASHNPGGPNGDFGIKYNASDGGPAQEAFTDEVFRLSKEIDAFLIDRSVQISTEQLAAPGEVSDPSWDGFTVEVIDPTTDYVALLQTIFDFEALRGLIGRSDFSFKYDGMHGVAGPYARRVFCMELGAPEECLLNCEPKEDFGGGHPDPNLTYAHELVALMGLQRDGSKMSEPPQIVPDFGAAADGDADRNMILGKGFFVTPSDSVALIAAHAKASIPYFKEGVTGVARSMPTSQALDRVAAKNGFQIFETPTGWKYFGNLMNAGLISICGEESFGTGSDHVREKDGLWAVLAWLSIIAAHNKDSPEGSLVSVETIVRQFWLDYGRVYYQRYDYEGVEGADAVIAEVKQFGADHADKTLDGGLTPCGFTNFTYNDPVDHSVSANQGLILNFSGPGINAARAVWRLSGTGSSGATIRLYLEVESSDDSLSTTEACGLLAKTAVALSKIEEFTGRKEPSVIT